METITIHEREIQKILHPAEIIPVIESAFADFYKGKITVPFPAHFETMNGVVHMKSAIANEKGRYAIKIASYFPGNTEKGINNIQGLVILYDGETGFPLVIMLDNALLTHHRTAAAGAIGAKCLSRKDSSKVFVVGAGTQGKLQIEYLMQVRDISEVGVYARNAQHKKQYVETMSQKFPHIRFFEAETIQKGCEGADIIITTTPNKSSPLIDASWVKPGIHITAVGSDGTGKQELDPRILAKALYVTDSTAQCEKKGELQHAIAAEITVSVHAEIGAIISGAKLGRKNADEVTVFDSTGLGAQDLAIAEYVYEKKGPTLADPLKP